MAWFASLIGSHAALCGAKCSVDYIEKSQIGAFDKLGIFNLLAAALTSESFGLQSNVCFHLRVAEVPPEVMSNFKALL